MLDSLILRTKLFTTARFTSYLNYGNCVYNYKVIDINYFTKTVKFVRLIHKICCRCFIFNLHPMLKYFN